MVSTLSNRDPGPKAGCIAIRGDFLFLQKYRNGDGELEQHWLQSSSGLANDGFVKKKETGCQILISSFC